MSILVSYLTKKQRGGVSRRDVEVSAGSLRIGRGADCEAHLPDPRVLLHHATISLRGGGYFIDAQGQAELRVNGNITGASSLRTGDKLSLGPYDLAIVEAPGYDFAITVELAKPLGDDLEQLKARSRVSVKAVGLGKRGWSWLLFVLVAIAFLALPIVSFLAKPDVQKQNFMAGHKGSLISRADTFWLSGDISGPHKFFGDSCEACHQQAFRMVRDEACLNCHKDIQHHADPKKFEFAAFGGQLCESCHKEHNGGAGRAALIVQDQTFCSDCHAGLKERASQTELVNVMDFGGKHPQFRPSIVADGATGRVVRVALDADPKPQEQSNLKFPHDKHLKKEGVRNPEKGIVKLECASCHAVDGGGVGILPIKMETHCQECHALRFDAKALNRQLPHGKPEQALLVLRDFYAGLALRGEVSDDDAPGVVRRRPGQELTEPQRLEALAWADRKAATIADQVIGKSLCGSCHTVTGGNGKWDVTKVTLASRWMPKARNFPHGRHQPVACVTCHAADQSTQATDVLMPQIATCQQCHGGDKAADKVPSTCISCHDFHQPHLGPMRGPAKQAALKP